jgi:hypothetical protein
MPFTFSFEEYADMIYVYGFCDGNSVLAVAEYQQRFPNRRIPNRRVFTGVYHALRDTGRLPCVRIADERGVNEGVVESYFQQRFSVNLWFAVLDDQLVSPFILQGRLTGKTYLRFLQ